MEHIHATPVARPAPEERQEVRPPITAQLSRFRIEGADRDRSCELCGWPLYLGDLAYYVEAELGDVTVCSRSCARRAAGLLSEG